MKKYGFVTLILMLLLAGCAKEVAPMRLGTMPTYSGAIYAVGVEQGFFEEAGIQVELTVFRSARDRDGAATAGQLDGFMTDIMGAVNLNAKGFPFMMTSREYDDFGVMAGSEVDIANVSLPKTGISENTVVDYIVDTYVEQATLKVNILAVPDRMGAVLSGELDYGVFPQPFMGIIMGNGGQMVLNTASKDFHPVVVVFAEDYIKDNEASVKAFYEGYAKTVTYMQETDYDVYKAALVTYGLAAEETVDLYRIPVEQYGLIPVAEKDFDEITAWMMDRDLLDGQIDFGAVTDFGFVE